MIEAWVQKDTGGLLSIIGRLAEGLESYIDAFRSAPDQPLVALCVSTSLFSLACSHMLVKNRRELCAKVNVIFIF